MRLILLAAALFLAAPALRADDGSFEGNGATVTSRPEPRIRMESETILIRNAPLSLDDPALAAFSTDFRDWAVAATRMAADCTFEFRNLTSQRIEVRMGFPDTTESGELEWPEGSTRAMFRAWVRGREIAVRHVLVESGESPLTDVGGFDAAWVWTVIVEPRERFRVRNTYRFGGTTSNGPMEACLSTTGEGTEVPREAWWTLAPMPACGRDPGNATCAAARYIVRTGAPWGGTIGRADITMDLPVDALPGLVVAVPTARSITSKTVRWHFENWEPTQDLTVVTVMNGWGRDESRCPLGPGALPAPFHSVEDARAWTKWARLNGVTGDAARLQRNALYAARGHRFRDPELRRFFDGMAWYRQRTERPSEDLGPEELRIVAELLRFERGAPRAPR